MKRRLKVIWQQHHEKTLVLADQAVVSGSNFVIGILIAKAFGLADLGVYAYAWMVLMMCSSLLQNLLWVPLVNEYVKMAEGEKEAYLGKVFICHMLFSCLAALLSALFILLLSGTSFFSALKPLVIALPILIFSYTLYDFARRAHLLKSNLLKVLLLDVLVNWSQVAFLVFQLWKNKAVLMDTMFFCAATYLFGLLWLGTGFKQSIRGASHFFSVLQGQWNNTRWLLATAILQWFAGNFFLVSAGSILGPESAGIVRIAQSVVGVLNVFFIALEMYVPARSSAVYHKGGREQLTQYTLRILRLGLIVCLLFVLVVTLFSSPLLAWLYGKGYDRYAYVVAVFAAFYTIVFVGYPLRFALRAMDKSKAMFVGYVLATVFSLFFSHIMIHAWGIWGVLAGLAGTQIIMQAWYVKELVAQPSIQ